MATTSNLKLVVVDDYKYSQREVEAGAFEFYRGSLVNSNAAGNIKPATDAASESFAGVATTALSQAAGGTAGDNKLDLIAAGSGKLVRMKMTGVTKADLDKEVFVVDNETVALAATTTNDVKVGVVREILSTDYCLVQI